MHLHAIKQCQCVFCIYYFYLFVYRYLELKFDQINENLRKFARDNESGIIQIWNNNHVSRSCQLLKILNRKYIIWIVM